MTAQQELELLAEIVGRMPVLARQVLTLRKAYGLTNQEISDRLAIPIATVARYLEQAALVLAAGLQLDGAEAVDLSCLWRRVEQRL